MDVNNLTNVYNQNPTLQGSYTLQQYLDLFGGSSTPTPTPTPGIPGIINQNINQYQGGGNDKQGGGGAFGNLDVSDVKTFQKDVYNSKTGQFEQQTVTGYKNPAMGNYQTFDGKNINHAGIGFKGIAGTVMEALGFGPEKDEKGYYDGQIAGTFTGFKPGDFKNMGEFFKTKKDRQKFMDDNKKTLDAIKKQKILKELQKMEEAKAAKAKKDLASLTTQGGGGGIASSGMTGAQAAGMGGGSRQATSAGSTSSGRTDGGWGWKDGGRVYLYNRLK